MPPITDFLLVAAGGALGACTRFAVQHFSFFETGKFYLTAIVNLAGCLLIGILWAVFSHFSVPRWLPSLCMAGFLGGFTTFSSFSLDVIQLCNTGRFAEAAFYLLLSVAGGLLCCAAGVWITNRLLFS